MDMYRTRSELLEKIHLTEDGFLELKEVRFAGSKIHGPSQSVLADEMAAFANSTGGVLLLGVENTNRNIVGIPLERLDEVEDLVLQACEDSVTPPLAPIIERMELPDATGVEKAVIRIEVARSLLVHQSSGGYLHRVGSSKRSLPPDQLARLFQQRSHSRLIHFDETPVEKANISDLDEHLWRRFASKHFQGEPETMLGKLAIAARGMQNLWHPTVAGVLMASRNPERFLPGAYVQAVAYRGRHISSQSDNPYQRDAQDITGPLDQQIRDTCAFVRKNMRVAARKNTEGGREDLPQFDLMAVFEAVTNAVAHRDYSIGGAKVRLHLFNDRLELYSPGMLSNTMTEESMALRQATRNEALTSLLARCPVDEDAIASHRQHIMDKRGEGVPIILERSKELSGRSPEYQIIDQSELKLTIYSAQQESD